MASTHIMTTEAECKQKAGENVSANFSDAMYTAAGLQGESTINCVCRFNYSDTWATDNVDVKGIISDFDGEVLPTTEQVLNNPIIKAL